MAVQKRGHEAAASRFQTTKRYAEILERQIETKRVQISNATLLHDELAELERRLIEAKNEHDIEARRVHCEVADERQKEFLAVACALDQGMTTEGMARFEHLASDLHSNFGRVKLGYEARRMTLQRLRGLVPGAPPLRARTYLATAQSWLRPPATEEAA